MVSRKRAQVCSVFIIIVMVLSSVMHAKPYNYSTDSNYQLQDSERRKQDYQLTLDLSRWSALVQKCISLRSAVVQSISASDANRLFTTMLSKNETYLGHTNSNGLVRNKSSNALYSPAFKGVIPRSGTSLLNEKNPRSTDQNINLKSVKVQDNTVNDSQHYLNDPDIIPKVQSKDSLGSCPVYKGKNVPPYVYQYRLSGSKYRQLLAGLALYNLSVISSNQSMFKYHKHYVPQPDEICKFGVRYENGKSDEMGIDCRAITHFILTEQSFPRSAQITKKIQNVNTASEKPAELFSRSLAVTIETGKYFNTQFNHEKIAHIDLKNDSHNNVLSRDSVKEMLSKTSKLSDTVNTVATVVMNATDPIFYGKPVNVTSKMECYVEGSIKSLKVKKAVPCDVLQKYTVHSINSSLDIMVKSLIMVALRFLFCYK